MSILNHLKDLVRPDGDEYDDYDEDMTSAWALPAEAPVRSAGDRELRIRTTTQLKVVLARPRTLEEIPAVADDLKSMMTVILNIEGVEREIARRILDTISGAAYALDASISRIASNTYMILPFNVELEGDLMNELTSSGLLGCDLDF
jgi:cell division inhibitor SepF